jgi:low temperature requirement protein LtrA
VASDESRPAENEGTDFGTPEAGSPTIGFLELFYDLVFVASTMVLSNSFSERLTWEWAAVCSLLYALVWMLWFHTTLLMNVERRDDFGHRSLVLIQMFLIAMTTLTFVDREATNNDFLGITYGLGVITVAAMYHRVAGRNRGAAEWAVVRRNRLLVAGLLLMVNTWLPDWADTIVFLFAIAVLAVPSSLGSPRKAPLPRVDVHHLTERAALLTLIMCGEAFVKVALVVSNGSIEQGDVIAIVVEFVVVFALFWTYFDDIPKAGIRKGYGWGELWMLAHLPLQIGIVAIAVGMSKYLQVHDGHVHDEVVGILGAGWVLVYGGLALIGWCGQRRPAGPLLALRAGTAVVALVLALTDWYLFWVEPPLFVGLLAALSVAHAAASAVLRRSTVVVPVVDAHGRR